MSLYIGAAVYGSSCGCLTCCAPGLPCCVAPCNSVNDDQADSDFDGLGDKVQLSPWLDSSLRSIVGSGLTASVSIGHAVSQLVYLSMAVLVVLSGPVRRCILLQRVSGGLHPLWKCGPSGLQRGRCRPLWTGMDSSPRHTRLSRSARHTS
jgi:hypothetical protein